MTVTASSAGGKNTQPHGWTGGEIKTHHYMRAISYGHDFGDNSLHPKKKKMDNEMEENCLFLFK